MRGPGVVFVGNLPPDVKEKEVDDLFYKARRHTGMLLLADSWRLAGAVSPEGACAGPVAWTAALPESRAGCVTLDCRCLGCLPLGDAVAGLPAPLLGLPVAGRSGTRLF